MTTHPAEQTISLAEAARPRARFPWTWALLVVGLTCLPYLMAWALTPDDLQFGGLLANPQDCNSYLAKMRLGAEGSLRFRLPYTSEEQTGHFLYLPYLLWGFVTVRLGLPLALAYHLGRALASLFFLWSAFRFLEGYAFDGRHLHLSWALVAVSSGLGWLALPFGHIAGDLWVSEAISFTSMFTNPHFPLASGLALWLFHFCTAEAAPGQPLARRALAAAACALGLALAQPFAAITAYGVTGGALAWRWLRQRAFPTAQAAVTALSLPPVVGVAAYTLYVVSADPLIRSWSAQNQTPTPPAWDVALTYGLVGLWALVGGWQAWRRGRQGLEPLGAWAVVNLAIIFLPLPMQRRLMMGLHVPLCGLAGYGLLTLAEARLCRGRERSALVGSVAGSAVSNLLILLIALSGVVTHDRHYYFSRAEAEAMEWLHQVSDGDGVVLAAPSTSLFVPVWAGLPVVYGHPMETAEAATRRGEVERFYRGEVAPEEEAAWLQAHRVRYIMRGPAEAALGPWQPEPPSPLRPVFARGDVTVFEVH
ncbi:MAG: hypothetical protein GX605_03225 [Chloroflexi bacterium]|nr:hypothetical protein [Chloroflexota bacterium]